METALSIGLSNAAGATLLALLAAAVGCGCRRPALVHSLWLLVLVKLLVPSPLLVRLSWPASEPVPVIAGERPVTVAVPSVMAMPELTDAEDFDAPADFGTVQAEQPTLPALAPTPPSESASTPWPWKSVVAAVWLGGSCLWWLVAGIRIQRFRRCLRFARPAPEAVTGRCRELSQRLGLAAAPGVYLAAGSLSPMLWALGRTPRLLLPAALWERLTEEQRDSLLVHELAHLRRRDHWVRRLELVVLGLYWWHPVAWWARRELQEAEEECCDAWVVWALPEAAPAYATALVETLAFVSQTRAALPLPASGVGHVRRLNKSTQLRQ